MLVMTVCVLTSVNVVICMVVSRDKNEINYRSSFAAGIHIRDV